MKLPLYKALLLILSSTLLISGSVYTLYFFSHKIHASRINDPQYGIRYLAHRGELPTQYLATLLHLSADAPTNAYALDLLATEKHLLANPHFQAVHLSLQPPDTLQIEYTLYRPVAILIDQTHTALSSGGTLVPSTATAFPTLYLGGGDSLLALEVFKSFPGATFVDVSCAQSESLGKRQIVVQLDGHLLRITPGSLESALERYHRLHGHLAPFSIIDLRLERLAFIQAGGAACLSILS